MKKRYRGFCPPFLAIGLVLLFMLLNVFTLVAHAAGNDNVIPGSEVAPPGGSTTIVTTDPEPNPEPDPEPQPEPGSDIQPPSTEPPSSGTVVVTPTGPETGQEPGTSEGTEPPYTEGIIPGEGSPLETENPPSPQPDPVGKTPGRLDVAGITVTSPTIEELTAKGVDLEALLYPSGLQLPTKYMDLLMLAPMSFSSTRTDEVAYFLKTAAPTEDNTYTYAEYSAAEVYLAVCRLIRNAEIMEVQPDVAKSFTTLDTSTTVNWMQNLTNATVSDSTRLVTLIANYKDILESYASGGSIASHRQYKDLTADHRGVFYSCGDLGKYAGPFDSSSVVDAQLATYVLGLYSWWDYIGVTQNLTSAVVEYSIYYNDFAYNGVNFSKGSPLGVTSSGTQQGSTTTTTVPDETGTQQPSGNTTQVGGLDGATSSGSNVVSGTSTKDDWTVSSGSDTPVSAVGSTNPQDTSMLPTGDLGLKEVGSIAALVFVGVAIVGLLIIRISRRGGHLF